MNNKTKDISLLFPIFGSHIKRIGWLRTLSGAFAMFLCIPGLMIAHLTFTVLLYQWLVCPLLGIKHVRWKDYVIIDRHRIKALSRIDRLNCKFCGYANGLCGMMNQEYDNLAEYREKIGFIRHVMLFFVMCLLIPFNLFMELSVQIIYNILVSRPLGMQRISIKEAAEIMKKNGYAAQFPPFEKMVIRSGKNTMFRFLMGLEQIESSWCPLSHFEKREGVVYPEHHKKFFGQDEIQEMRKVLKTEGTVSDRKPTW